MCPSLVDFYFSYLLPECTINDYRRIHLGYLRKYNFKKVLLALTQLQKRKVAFSSIA